MFRYFKGIKNVIPIFTPILFLAAYVRNPLMSKNKELFRFDQEISSEKHSILVVTPFPELGEIICESLKEVAKIEHVQKVSQAISSIKNHPDYGQAILDMEFGGLNLLNLGKALRLIYPAIEILIISKDEKPTDLDEIQPWKFLRKPLLLHDLEAALDIKAARDDSGGAIIDLDALDNDNNGPIRWSSNQSLASRYLSRLIEKSYAQEALLIQNHEVWSFAGRLPEESVYELSYSINKCMAKDLNADLARFITLETTQSEYAIYASLLFVGVILALVFDPDIPLGVVRKQTKEFANTLMILDGNDIPVESLSSGYGQTNCRIEERNNSRKQIFLASSTCDDKKLKKPNTAHFLNEVINPFTIEATNPDKKEQTQIKDSTDSLINSNSSVEPDRFNAESRVMDNESDHNENESENNHLSFLHEFIPDALYNLTYSCLLIPRFTSHPLTRDREEKVAECIKDIHTSKGWRLESLKVRPEYILWSSNFPPNITPSRHIEMIRKETSKLLFEDFPAFKKENPFGDYWAPGYLIVGGKNAISDQLVSAFSRQNRKKYAARVVESRSSRERMGLQYLLQMS